MKDVARFVLYLAVASLAMPAHAAAAAQVAAPGATAQTVSKPQAPPPTNQDEAEATKLMAAGKLAEASSLLTRSAAAYRRDGDRSGLARIALKRGTIARALKQPDLAQRHAVAARQLAGSDPLLQIGAISQLAALAADRADFAGAEAFLGEALELAERAGNAGSETRILRDLGRYASDAGRQEEALGYARRAVAAADRSGDVALRVDAIGVVVNACLGLSKYDEALSAAQRGYEMSRTAAHPLVRANGLNNLAQATSHIWNLDRAVTLWAETIEAYRQASSIRGESVSLRLGGDVWFALGEFDRAIDDIEKAAGMLGKAGLGAIVGDTYARLALSEIRRGRTAEAAQWLSRARAELPRTPEARHVFLHNDAGLVAIELRQFAEARADFMRVLEVARKIGNVEYEWRAHWGFGRTAIAEGKPDEAVPHLETAIANIERLRQTIPEAGMRAAFMTQRVAPYETLVEGLMAGSRMSGDDHARQALGIAERARGRALADLLAEARASLTDPRLARVRANEAAFGPRFSAAQRRVIDAADAAARADALRELQAVEQEFETLVLEIRRENPAYAALAHPRALTAAEIARDVAPDEALIEFALSPKQGFAWVVRRDGIVSYRVPGNEALAPQVRLMQALVEARDDEAVRRLGAHLFDELLRPGAAAFATARRLIVVSDGVLLRLPFALLRSGNEWLVERQMIAYAPSATILDHLRRSGSAPAPQPLLALAAPEGDGATRGAADFFDARELSARALTHAAREARHAGRVVGAGADDVLIGVRATESALKQVNASRYRILHFAAHAIADEMVPRRSAILLAGDTTEDGLLQIHEIANLSLNADLVVLASCRSQVGRVVRGEGLLSLSRAFMHGGARAVLATLWAVDDRETAWLMQRFYRELGDGLPPDEALRSVQLQALRAGGRFANPATWASFVVSGDGSRTILARRPPDYRPLWAWTLTLMLVALAGASMVSRARRQRTVNRPAADV